MTRCQKAPGPDISCHSNGTLAYLLKREDYPGFLAVRPVKLCPEPAPSRRAGSFSFGIAATRTPDPERPIQAAGRRDVSDARMWRKPKMEGPSVCGPPRISGPVPRFCFRYQPTMLADRPDKHAQ